MPFAYRHFLAGRSRLHTLNGGCRILFRRDAYESIGGHGSVRDGIAEDTALARVLDSAGQPYMLADGRSVLAVRMYRSLREALRGFGKNSGSFLAANHPVSGAATVLSTILAGLPFALALKAFLRRYDCVCCRQFCRPHLRRPVLTAVHCSSISESERWSGAGALQPLAQVLFLSGALSGHGRSLRRPGFAGSGRDGHWMAKNEGLAPRQPRRNSLGILPGRDSHTHRPARASAGRSLRRASGGCRTH